MNTIPIKGRIIVSRTHTEPEKLAASELFRIEQLANDGPCRFHLFLDEMTPENLAQMFHASYERLAPEHGYQTREASAKPWADVPEQNKRLMIAVCEEMLTLLRS